MCKSWDMMKVIVLVLILGGGVGKVSVGGGVGV